MLITKFPDVMGKFSYILVIGISKWCFVIPPSCFEITLSHSIVVFGGQIFSWYRCFINYAFCKTGTIERAFITFATIALFTSVILFSITIENFCIMATNNRWGSWRLVLSMKPWSYIWLEFGLFSTIIAIIRACACWALFVVTLTNTVHLIYIYIYIYMYMYIYLWVYVYVCMYIYMCICANNLNDPRHCIVIGSSSLFCMDVCDHIINVFPVHSLNKRFLILILILIQRASNKETVSMSWGHHALSISSMFAR